MSIITTRAPAPGSAHYATAKAAVVMLTRQLAAEWGPRGVRINAVAPGIIDTWFGQPADQRRSVDAARRARHEPYIPLGREGTAEDVAYVILFLCSKLAGYVTGCSTAVDESVRMPLSDMPAIFARPSSQKVCRASRHAA